MPFGIRYFRNLIYEYQYSEIFHEQILFGIWYSTIRHEQIYSVIGIWSNSIFGATLSWTNLTLPDDCHPMEN